MSLNSALVPAVFLVQRAREAFEVEHPLDQRGLLPDLEPAASPAPTMTGPVLRIPEERSSLDRWT